MLGLAGPQSAGVCWCSASLHEPSLRTYTLVVRPGELRLAVTLRRREVSESSGVRTEFHDSQLFVRNHGPRRRRAHRLEGLRTIEHPEAEDHDRVLREVLAVEPRALAGLRQRLPARTFEVDESLFEGHAAPLSRSTVPTASTRYARVAHNGGGGHHAAMAVTRILVVGNTRVHHWGDVYPRVREAVAEADIAFHCGDIVHLDVVAGFRKTAKRAIVVHGNTDPVDVRRALPYREIVEVDGVRIGVLHPSWGGPEFEPEVLFGDFPEGVDVIAYGHLHEPVNEVVDGVLFVNGGRSYASFLVPATMAWLIVEDDPPRRDRVGAAGAVELPPAGGKRTFRAARLLRKVVWVSFRIEASEGGRRRCSP